MEKTKMRGIPVAVNWLFLLYFAILFGERTQSLVRSFADRQNSALGTAFGGYVTVQVLLSLVATAVLLIGFNRGFWQGLFRPDAQTNYQMLCLTAGVMLLSGMVHTAYTVGTVQFVSYGMLIAAMILQTVKVQAEGQVAHPASLWLSLLYLTALSMAIPVVYHSEMTNAGVFHAVEAVVSVVLVVTFTVLLRQVFLGQGENLFHWLPILLVAVGDTLVIALRWREEINRFVLIFAVLSVILWVVGKVLLLVQSK